MKVTKFHTNSRYTGSRLPASGDAWFDDGRSFRFYVNANDKSVWFTTERKRQGTWESVSFQAPKRAAALVAHPAYATPTE